MSLKTYSARYGGNSVSQDFRDRCKELKVTVRYTVTSGQPGLHGTQSDTNQPINHKTQPNKNSCGKQVEGNVPRHCPKLPNIIQ